MALFDPAGHHLVKHRIAWRRGAIRVSPKDFKELNVNWWTKRRGRRRWWQTENDIRISDNEVPSYVRLSSRILRICRAMYDEAVGILYSQPITLTDTYALHDFMVQIGPKHKTLLRDVEVCEWGSGGAHGAMNYPAMAAMVEAVNLERIKLNVNKWGVSFCFACCCLAKTNTYPSPQSLHLECGGNAILSWRLSAEPMAARMQYWTFLSFTTANSSASHTPGRPPDASTTRYQKIRRGSDSRSYFVACSSQAMLRGSGR